ncbi:hypothetical protein [Tenacibaculum finnmarkense]|uniref:hypothetical protein n=1 Tax=Tenacibaculum finnmarkense TaxID=2781243 RepID=UPI001E5ECD74|nr:hypothetical protein [Tenacibaculum finnmarkense]MCD8422560.1 hypothetical protein [Tenacibaculum finnmarkense genomovar ulcerans]MCG8238565.1 hypothetical protein [Tenacibaculum finnmarkense genomovar ulcerans]MCG8830121.1 hypothetical protein [Tenacibaculum finnmarkense]
MQHKSNHIISTKTLQNVCNNVFLAFMLFLFTQNSFGQGLKTLKGTALQNKVRLNFIPVKMPTDKFPNLKPTMGLAGLHYQIPINNWLYGGAGFHFAVTGDQGGLFTLGAELGVNKQLYKNLYVDANLHFGGGGGYRNLVNDGGFINPNIGLQYKKDNYSFGVQYSHLNFLSGEIKSNSVSLFVEIPSILRFTDYNKAHQNFTAKNISSDNFWSKPVVKNAQQIRFDFFKPFGNSKKDNGTPLNETLYVLGFEYQKYLSENTFLFAHTDAIYKGLRAGFMDLFFGAGYHPYQSKYINIFTKLAVGAAGGRVAPEGGLMVYPSAGIDLKITDKVALSGHGGYYRAIAGDLEAYTVGFGLKYYGLNGGTTSEEKKYTNFYTQGLRVEIQNQTYFDVAKTDDKFGAKEIDLQLIGLKVNYDINKWLYIAGEASFAYDGRSGGYAHGLVGAGIYTPRFLNNKVRGFAELMAGAGGGAGIDTDQGIVIRPTLGFSYDIHQSISILASGGKYYSPFGNVNSTNINIGLSLNLSTLSVKN